MLYRLVVFLLCIWAALFVVFAFYGAYVFNQTAPEPYRWIVASFAVLTVLSAGVGAFVYWLNSVTGD